MTGTAGTNNNTSAYANNTVYGGFGSRVVGRTTGSSDRESSLGNFRKK